MGTALVTVSCAGSRADLALADDCPIEALIPALVARCVPEPRPWSRWALAEPGRPPLAPSATLADAGVVDGGELDLRDMAEEREPSPTPAPLPALPSTDPRRDALRRRLIDLVERMVEDVGALRAGRNPLLDYASPPARRRLRELAPSPWSQAPGELADLRVVARWGAAPDDAVTVTATLTELQGAGEPAGHRGTGPGPHPQLTLRLILDPPCERVLEAELP
jgi:hypothetical protein